MVMQYEPHTPLRAPVPVFCPSCGASVTAAMRACAVCGAANPAAKLNATLNRAAAPEGSLSNEARRTQAARSCARCGARLGPIARFCQRCGGAVDERIHHRSEPPRENVVPISQPAPAPQPEPPPQEVRRPGRHISLAVVDDELDEYRPQPSKLQDIDYLDALLGQKAPGSEPPPPKPPAWRLGRHLVVAGKAEDMLPEGPGVPVPASRDRLTPRPSDTDSLAIAGAVGFALVALGMVVLVHLAAPSEIPGYSAAELDLKVQMRAVEWLLAAILAALLGLLLKR